MNINLYTAQMGLLITLLLIFLVVCSASNENRASPTSSVSAKKPPFNGSIFGKRSNLPALQSIQDGYGYVPMAPSNDDSGNFAFDLTDRGQIGLLIQQQEALVRLAISQCIALQQQRQGLEADSAANALCASLSADPKDGLRRNSLAVNSWFDQMATRM